MRLDRLLPLNKVRCMDIIRPDYTNLNGDKNVVAKVLKSRIQIFCNDVPIDTFDARYRFWVLKCFK